MLSVVCYLCVFYYALCQINTFEVEDEVGVEVMCVLLLVLMWLSINLICHLFYKAVYKTPGTLPGLYPAQQIRLSCIISHEVMKYWWQEVIHPRYNSNFSKINDDTKSHSSRLRVRYGKFGICFHCVIAIFHAIVCHTRLCLIKLHCTCKLSSNSLSM